MNTAEQLTADIAEIVASDQDDDLVAGLVARGWVKQGEDVQVFLPLTSYKPGDKVQVIKNGQWMDAFVQDVQVSPGLTMLSAHTDRSPATVMSPTAIQRRFDG